MRLGCRTRTLLDKLVAFLAPAVVGHGDELVLPQEANWMWCPNRLLLPQRASCDAGAYLQLQTALLLRRRLPRAQPLWPRQAHRMPVHS
jgi:hypothetical protein